MAPRVKIQHEMRMNWGGNSPRADYDSDIFNRLSPARQAEIIATQQSVRDNPKAQVWLIYDPKTRQPYPGQILLSDIEEKLKASRRSLPEVPAGYRFSVPNGVPRGVFSYMSVPEPTEQQAYQILLALETHLTGERILTACTYEQRLLSDKPLDGLYAFVWRLARYISGQDNHIPSTAFVDLIDGVSHLTHLRVNPGRVTTITKLLQSKAEELVRAIGGSHQAGSLKWAQATGASR